MLSLVIALMCTAVAFGQKPGKLLEKAYFKLSPMVIYPKGASDLSAGINAGAGYLIGRYVELGLAAGYYKFKDWEKGITQVGLELNVTDFKRKKIKPAFTLGAYYPVMNKTTTKLYGRAGVGMFVEDKSKGQYQVSSGVGVSIPITEKRRIFITAGYGLLGYKFSSKSTTTVLRMDGSLSSTTKTSPTTTESLGIAHLAVAIHL